MGCDELKAELERLTAECCRCERCGHVQAEPNWCHRCGHRTIPAPWARKLLRELEDAAAARVEAESALQEVSEVVAAHWAREAAA